MKLETQQKLYNALLRIARYQTPKQLRRDTSYGLEYEEALEMAYENVLYEAKKAITGVKQPL